MLGEVSEFEIFRIWHTVDENKDTLVSWEEFLAGERVADYSDFKMAN